MKTEQDREFRELDSSISSNLSEREGKKERREEQRGKERTVGAKSVWQEFKSQNVF